MDLVILFYGFIPPSFPEYLTGVFFIEWWRVLPCWLNLKKEFYSQHQQNCKYDLASHSTECLKRAHQSTAAVSDQLFQNCLFPVFACRKHIPSSEPHFYGNCKLDLDGNSAVRQRSDIELTGPVMGGFKYRQTKQSLKVSNFKKTSIF